jgi:hypothetical protein
MDPQAPPPTVVAAPSAATYAHHPDHHDGQCHGQVPYTRQHPSPTDRASRSSNVRSHDSVVSHPFSPKPSSPPSPTSTVSSAAPKHRSGDHDNEIQHPPSVNISYPAHAHLDPEKAAASPHRRDSNLTIVLYDSSEYMEKGPEEKPIQLLVCPSPRLFLQREM